MMFLQVIILLAGFLFLVKGADWFVEGAASIAKKLGIPQLIIGLTIVAMGTSMPEAAVSITAAMNKNAGITIGNVVGSNILNILIILGITAVITNVAIQRSTLLYEIPFMTVITIVLLIFGITGSEVTFIEGVIFWILFLIYLGYLFVMAKKGNDQEEAEAKDIPVWKCMLLMVIGGILVVKGSDFAVSGATEIARYFGMSERFIGLTIVALGTSLPELVTSVTAARRGNAGIAIGNIVGSNILNILIILGITAVITNVAIQRSTLLYEIPFMIVITIVLLIFGITGSEVTFIEGVIFWILFLIYLGYLFVMAKKGNDQEEAEAKDNPVWKCMLLMVIGGILVVKGSDFAVSGATEIARYFGMSERFIGLTIVALGTSLPELVTSVTAARRGNAGIAIGNIVGSNIFNILFVIGATALICTVPFESKFIIDTVVAVLCGAILWIGTFRHKELRKPCGVIMLLCYVAYFLYLCLL